MSSVQSMACSLNANHSPLVQNAHRSTVWRCCQRVSTNASRGQRRVLMPSSSYRHFRNEIADRQCESLEKVNLTHSLQRNDHTITAAEMHQGSGWMNRIGFISSAFSALGLWMFTSNGMAAELGPISSDTLLSVEMLPRIVLVFGDLDPGTAQLATSLVGPVFTIFNLLFIFRIVMSWYPGIPVKRFPFFLVYNPTEPVLGPTRRLIPPVGGVDVAPVIWVALLSFANEILLGKQGLLVLLSQQQT